MAEVAQEPMERERRTLREISPERNLALAIGLAVLAACQPIEARPTDETPIPTPTPEVTPTPEEEPTPTVVKRGIETIQREIGGVQGTDFLVAYKDEIQEGIQFELENGQRWFILGVYPDLPGWGEETHFEDEYVLYNGSAGSPEEGERMVFLTARGANKKYNDALPFYWKEQTVSGPNGNFFYIKEGRMVAVAEPFVNLEENEAKIVFNREAGRYEFLDESGEITRTIEVFNPAELPEVITPEIVDQYFVGITPQEAQRLYEETGKFVLPFDPRGIEFSIGEAEAKNGSWVIGFRVPRGTIFYAPFKSRLDLVPVAVDRLGSTSKIALLENSLSPLVIEMRDAEFLVPDLEGKGEVETGTSLMRLSSEEDDGEADGLGQYHFKVLVYYYPLNYKIENFLTIEGKYVYIVQ